MTDIDKAFDFSKYQRVLQNQRDLLKIRVDTRSTVGYNGGLFKANPDTIVFLKLLLDEGKVEQPLMDINENPIMVNLQNLYDELVGRHTEVMNEYYNEYVKLQNSRDVVKLTTTKTDTFL